MIFLYPWYLLGLFAISIPVIIHLLQLRRPQRVSFTNTLLIRHVELVTTRRRKLQNLLILVARVVGIVALVLVFSQPFLLADKSNHAISGINIAVDNSCSMQVPGVKYGTLLSEAIEDARQLVSSVASGKRIRFLNAGKSTLNTAAFLAKVDGLKLGRRSINKQDVLAASVNSDGILYLLSDFQKIDFPPSILQRIPLGGQVVLVPVSGPATGNIFVDSLWVNDGFVRVRADIGLHLRVRNGGALAVKDCPVKVFIGTRQVAAFRVSVEPGQAVSSIVQVQLSDDKLALGRIVTQDAPISFDNTYYFTLQPASVIQVLEIGGEPVAQQVYANEPLFSYRFARPQNVDFGIMRQANLVLVQEVATIDAGLRDALQAVVKRGGNVVLVPSALPAARASYQQLFRQLGIGTAEWVQVAASPELRDVTIPSAQQPFFRDVFGAQVRPATMPRVAPVLRWARTGTDIMRLRDGESYLAEFASGTGRVYVFSAPFDKRYSDFTGQALFVPVMYRMAMLSYRDEQQPAYRLSQRTVTLQLPGGTLGAGERADEPGVKLVKDSVTLLPEQRVVGQEVRLTVPQGMSAAGFYQVQRGGRVVSTLAFNQDKRESELAAYSAAELREMIGPNRPNITVLDGKDIGTGTARLQGGQNDTPLWRYFLLLALLALLAEALLVRFGRRSVGKLRGTVTA